MPCYDKGNHSTGGENMKRTGSLTVKLPQGVLDALQATADATGLSRSELVRRAIAAQYGMPPDLARPLIATLHGPPLSAVEPTADGADFVIPEFDRENFAKIIMQAQERIAAILRELAEM